MLEQLNNPNTIIVIGRGHSGTRLISFALSESGVYMGEPHNIAGDLLPPQPLYAACRIMGPFVRGMVGVRMHLCHRMYSRLVTAALQPTGRAQKSPGRHIKGNRGRPMPDETDYITWLGNTLQGDG